MSNTVLTISMITRESLRILENNLVFTKQVNREYDDAFGKTGAKIGNTLNLRLPARYVGRTGPTLSIENQTENYFPLTLDTQFGVDVQFTSQDMELSMDDFSERVLAPAIAAVANKIDSDGLAKSIGIYNAVGTPGTANNALTNYLSASAKLKLQGCPQDNLRSIILDPLSEASVVGALTTLFNPSEEISNQYKNGTMGKAIGFKWSCDQNVASYTTGAQGGSPQYNGSGAHDGTDGILSTKGWNASAAPRLKKGDVFTIAAVYAVNPQSRLSTGQLQQFVVTADFSSDGSGNGDVSISPTIVTSGQFQNVNAAAVGNAALTVLGAASVASPMSLAFHRDAFVLACADMPLPRGVHMASRVSSKKVGLSIRMVQAYDVVNDIFPCRLDVLYGWAVPYAQLACRIQS
jgi:hypothetical protein